SNLIKEQNIYVRAFGHGRAYVGYYEGGNRRSVFAHKRESAKARDDLLQNRDHFDDRAEFVRAQTDHPEDDVQNDSQADITDPPMILQEVSKEARSDAQQRNRESEAEYENDRMLPRGTGDSENSVERDRYVSDDDLPGRLDESFARDMCGNRSIGVDIITCQCLGGLLPWLDRCAQLSPHLPAYPEEKKAPAE